MWLPGDWRFAIFTGHDEKEAKGREYPHPLRSDITFYTEEFWCIAQEFVLVSAVRASLDVTSDGFDISTK